MEKRRKDQKIAKKSDYKAFIYCICTMYENPGGHGPSVPQYQRSCHFVIESSWPSLIWVRFSFKQYTTSKKVLFHN